MLYICKFLLRSTHFKLPTSNYLASHYVYNILLTGYLKDQKEFEESLRKNNMTLAATLYGPGQDRLDRFQLNDMSFAGPVIMGIGGK